MKRLFFLLTASMLVYTPAYAQWNDDQANMQRMERLERELQLLQRQVARGESPTVTTITPLNENEVADTGGPAALGVRLSQMEEEMRALRGKVEEVEFKNRQLAENLEKLQRDTEFRFNEIKPGTTAMVAETATETASKNERKPLAGNAPEGSAEPTEKPSGEFANPRDHYQHAFRLLQQTNYEEASKSFADFIKRYPKDPLIGNAYYWQGETFYIRRDYVGAADHFRQGFEALPNGQKAGDNLLKLAMSLNALQRDKEACVVLGQVISRFKKKSPAIGDKAQQERERIGC
jgi:tol-pal system protein YbgF